MTSLCKEVKVYHIHNNYYLCQRHSIDSKFKNKRKAISLNNNNLIQISQKQFSPSKIDKLETQLHFHQKINTKKNIKGLSLSLKNPQSRHNRQIQKCKLKQTILPKNQIIHKINQNEKKQNHPYVHFNIMDSAFNKKILCSTKESIYLNNQSQLTRFKKSQLSSPFDNCFQIQNTKIWRLGNYKQQYRPQIKYKIQNDADQCNYLSFYQNQSSKNICQMKASSSNKLIQSRVISNQRIVAKNKLFNQILKQTQPTLSQFLTFDKMNDKDKVYQSKNNKTIPSKNNFFLTAEQRANMIDRQTIVSHYYKDQLEQTLSYILDESLIIQRQTIEKYIKTKAVISDPKYTIYTGVNMEEGQIVTIKEYRKCYKSKYQQQIQKYDFLNKTNDLTCAILKLKEISIQFQNLVLIKQGFLLSLQQYLKNTKVIKTIKTTLKQLFKQLLNKIQYFNFSLIRECKLSDFIISQNQKLKVQNILVLQRVDIYSVSAYAEQLAEKLNKQFFNCTDYQ